MCYTSECLKGSAAPLFNTGSTQQQSTFSKLIEIYIFFFTLAVVLYLLPTRLTIKALWVEVQHYTAFSISQSLQRDVTEIHSDQSHLLGILTLHQYSNKLLTWFLLGGTWESGCFVFSVQIMAVGFLCCFYNVQHDSFRQLQSPPRGCMPLRTSQVGVSIYVCPDSNNIGLHSD